MEIHQLLVSASPGDAITTEALLLREHLRRISPSEVFAQHLHPALPEVQSLRAYARLSSAVGGGNLLIVHGSIGDAPFFDFLRRRPERLVLRFHNLTPVELVRAHDPRLAGLLERGGRDLERLAPQVALAVATSQFTAGSLAQLGYSGVRVAPVLVDVGSLERLPEPSSAPAALRPPDGRPLVLFVGRLVPHKRQDAILAAFHVLKTYLRPDAHLALVGGAPPGAYVDALHRYAASLALLDVAITGSVAPAVLAAAYRRADAFVCLSAHEGFCVPLVEAMAFGVPIVAGRAGAVGEVLGDAGVLLDEPPPTLVAEAVAALLEKGGIRGRLVDRGLARAAAHDPARSAASLLEHLGEVV